MEENEPVAQLQDAPQAGAQPQAASEPLAVAPAVIAPSWHTILLIAGIIAISIHGATRFSATHGPVNRLLTYGFTGAMELCLLGWVVLGLKLKKVPLRSLYGSLSGGFRSFALDIGIALVFWFGALMILGTLSLVWMGVEAAVEHGQPSSTAGETFAPAPAQRNAMRAMRELAPANGEEMAGWALLCLLIGVVEETVFRGYLQRQFTAWGRGNVAVGVVFSALAFGGAHAYQGTHNMVLLAVFGALFSLLALVRRSLRPGIFAHSWHDLVAGIALALLKSHHLI